MYYTPEEAGYVYASCEVVHAYTLYMPVPCRIRRSHLGSCSKFRAGSWSIKHFWGLGCLLHSLKHCSAPADAFVGHTPDVTEYDCGDDRKKSIYALVHCNQEGALVCDGTNLKQWYLTLVSSSLSVLAFGRDSEKLVQSGQISPMAAILNALLNPSKIDN